MKRPLKNCTTHHWKSLTKCTERNIFAKRCWKKKKINGSLTYLLHIIKIFTQAHTKIFIKIKRTSFLPLLVELFTSTNKFSTCQLDIFHANTAPHKVSRCNHTTKIIKKRFERERRVNYSHSIVEAFYHHQEYQFKEKESLSSH